MTKLFSGKNVNVQALKTVLEAKIAGVNFDDKAEIQGYINEYVVDLVERPIYDESDFTHDDGHDIYDLVDNVDELRDMKMI